MTIRSKTMATVALTAVGSALPQPDDMLPSLEGMIYEGAAAALADAGLVRDDLDGVVIAASDQVPGVKTAVATGAGGSHQFFNVAVLEGERRE